MVQRVSLEDGECQITTVFDSPNAKIVALEVDSENNDYLYFLNDEQHLVHLQALPDEKCLDERVLDLSVHKIQELIENFDQNNLWDSILIDDRTVTIQSQTFSLNTNLNYVCRKSGQDNSQTWSK